MKYRADIDGLRAIAVVSVVVYHLGNSVKFNGYLGVDIFFVISGFLIASIINGDIEQGTFLFSNFYEKRIRRIIPLLLTVLLVTAIFGFLILLPNEALPFSKSIVASLFFSSNFLFYLEAGYFDASAELKPLLHTWSLSVEEQFYIVFPILMIFALKQGNKFTKLFFASLLLLSLTWNASFPALFKDQDFAFFMFPVRAWELLTGVLLALAGAPISKVSRTVGNAIAFFGLFCISFGLLYPYGDEAAYVLKTLPVVVGTALVIYSGTVSTHSDLGVFLSNKLFVFLGKISYSLYLWHWPIYVLALYQNYGRLDDLQRSIIGVACVLISYLSWKYIEQPFRQKHNFSAISKATKLGLVTVLGMLSVSCYAIYSSGSFPWTSKKVKNFATVQYGGEYEWVKFDGMKALRLGQEGNHLNSSIVLMGDSHALAIAPVIDQLSHETKRTGLFFDNWCVAALEGLPAFPSLQKCSDDTSEIAKFLSKLDGIKTIIIAQRWHAKTRDWSTKFGVSEEEAWYLREQSLQNLVEKLSAPEREIVILAQVPLVETRHKTNLPSVVARMIQNNQSDLEKLAPNTGHYLKKNARALDLLKRIAERTGANIVYPHEQLCNAKTCAIYDDGGMLYWDDDHLSIYGAQKLIPSLENYF